MNSARGVRTILIAAVGLLFALAPEVRAAPTSVDVTQANPFHVPGGWDGTQFTQINPDTEEAWKFGDTYQLTFVTGEALGGFDGSTVDVLRSDLHGFVYDVANIDDTENVVDVDEGLEWFALASVREPDGQEYDARDIAPVSGPVYRSDGELVAKDFDQFWSDLQNPIESDWTGTLTAENIGSGGWSLDGPFVWTGTDQDGTSSGHPIGEEPGFHDGEFRPRPSTGRADWGGGNHTFEGNRRNTVFAPLYGLSGELELVPEPGSLALLGLGLFGIVALSGRRRRRR